MASVRFNLKDNNTKGKTLVYLIFRYNGKKLKYSTGQKVIPKSWNKNKMEVRSSYEDSLLVNPRLKKIDSEINTIYNRYFTQGIEPSVSQLRDDLNTSLRGIESVKNNEFDFFQAYDEFMTSPSKSLGTRKKYKSLYNHLVKFDIKKKISFENIDMLFYDSLMSYFIERKMVNETIGKYISTLKAFMRWSLDRKYHDNQFFKDFKVPRGEKDIVYLTKEELDKLLDFDLSASPRLEHVRNLFCLGCTTGLRYSDLLNLKKENIYDSMINITTIKTSHSLHIPLNRRSKKLLDVLFVNQDYIKQISNQKMNEYIKELCKIVRIDTETELIHFNGKERIIEKGCKYNFISTHTARRTFIVLSLEGGMRAEVVMEITGHRDYRTFQRYIKIANETAKLEMNNAWN